MPDFPILPHPHTESHPSASTSSVAFSLFDTLVLIAAHLSVPELVRLSLTSHSLYNDINDSRIIWLKALLALETTQCMVPFTYPVETMDIAALKVAACTPYRLGSAFYGRGSVRAGVRYITIDTSEQGPPPQYAIYLIPGGRWIIYTDRGPEAKSGGPARISCADLKEFNPTTHMSSFPLRHPVDTWPTISAVQANPERVSIMIAVTYLYDYPLRCIEIIQATWRRDDSVDDMPTWKCKAHLEYNMTEAVQTVNLENDILLVPSSHSIIVWNWRYEEWAHIVWPESERIKDAWSTPSNIFVVSDYNNAIYVLDMPTLHPISAAPAQLVASPSHRIPLKPGAEIFSELAVLSQWTPLARRPHRLVTLIYWSRNGSGLLLLDYSDPRHLRIVRDWPNYYDDDSFGVHSGSMQAVDVQGIAVRAGRHFLSRLHRGAGEMEFRALGHFREMMDAKTFSLSVALSNFEWDEAEAYDSCTIFGRILLRQYESGSDSELSDSEEYPQMALMDIV